MKLSEKTEAATLKMKRADYMLEAKALTEPLFCLGLCHFHELTGSVKKPVGGSGPARQSLQPLHCQAANLYGC